MGPLSCTLDIGKWHFADMDVRWSGQVGRTGRPPTLLTRETRAGSVKSAAIEDFHRVVAVRRIVKRLRAQRRRSDKM
jgi:hypothetical protein